MTPQSSKELLTYYQSTQRELWPKIRERMYRRKSFGIMVFETEDTMKKFINDLNKLETFTYIYQTYHFKNEDYSGNQSEQGDYTPSDEQEYPSIFILPKLKVKNKDMREFIKTCILFYHRSFAITLDSDKHYTLIDSSLEMNTMGDHMYHHTNINHFAYISYFETGASIYYSFT